MEHTADLLASQATGADEDTASSARGSEDTPLILAAQADITAFDTTLLSESVSLLGALSEYDAPVWLLLVWIVVLGTVVPFGAELAALRHLRATTVTMVAMLEPVGVSVLGWIWFGESLDAVAVVGGVAVVSGIVLAQTARRVPVQVEPPLVT